jgi:protein SCO1/2
MGSRRGDYWARRARYRPHQVPLVICRTAFIACRRSAIPGDPTRITPVTTAATTAVYRAAWDRDATAEGDRGVRGAARPASLLPRARHWSGRMRSHLVAPCGPLSLAAACSSPSRPPASVREFPLTGEVLAIKPDKSEVQVKHDEVKGFMDAMTMWFSIKEPRLLDGVAPGDLISATLVLTAEDSYLTGIRKTGSRPPGQATAPRRTGRIPAEPPC